MFHIVRWLPPLPPRHPVDRPRGAAARARDRDGGAAHRGRALGSQRPPEEHHLPSGRRARAAGARAARSCSRSAHAGTRAERVRAPGGAGPDLVALAAESLERLARASGETANLGVATSSGDEMLDQRDSRHFIGSTNWVGRPVPNHGSVVGKVFLAEDAVPFPEGPLERLAPSTITAPTALRRDLEWIRPRGYATAVDELERGSGRSRHRCATPAARSSRPWQSPALPSASVTACSTSSAGSCATRPLPCRPAIGYDDAKRGAA